MRTDYSTSGSPRSSTSKGPTSTASATPGLKGAIRASERDWWSAGARKVLRRLIASGRPFTSEHITDEIGEPHDAHQVGAVVSAAQRQGLIESYGATIGRDGRARRQWVAAPERAPLRG